MTAQTLGLMQAASGPQVDPMVVWLIPLLPIFGFLFQVFIGRRLPRIIINVVSCGLVAVSAGISWYLFSLLLGMDEDKRVIVADLARWIYVPGLGKDGFLAVVADHKLVVDTLTAVMILVVTNIGFLIHLYSTGYMAPPGHEPEKRYGRFFAYLNLFTGFMLILVMGSNFLLMFVGWEGVGLCSYLLIGFWYEEKANAIAGMKAFVVNRVGDLFFTIGVLTLFVTLGTATGTWTVDFTEIRGLLETEAGSAAVAGVATFICIFLFLGATGKSAQIPLYVWLPDAMAGPTPVSALIHAATMVTAGVYMIARLNFLFAMSPFAMGVVALVGAITAVFAGTIGMAQNDIKKVLAYSTVSQLGYMFMAVGVGAFGVGVFHLFTHAFFKACLFLGSGSVIIAMGHEQDIRKMGGLLPKMKITGWTFIISSLALAGFPLMAGFFSKDAILENAAVTHAFDGTVFAGWLPWTLFGMGVIGAFCTAYYMTRLVVKTFFGRPQWQQQHAFSGGGVGDDPSGTSLPDDESALDMDRISGLPQDESMLDLHAPPGHGASGHDSHGGGHGHGGHHAGEPHESPWTMTLPLIILAIGAVLVGWLNIPTLIGGHHGFQTWLDPATNPKWVPGGAPEEHHGSAALLWGLMIFSVVVGLTGIGAGLWVFFKRHGVPAKDWADRNPDTYQMLLNKYYVDEVYDKVVLQNTFRANEAAGRIDNEIVDGAVNGAARVSAKIAKGSGYADNEVVDAAVNAAANVTQATGKKVRRLQTGNIKEYLTFALVGGLFIIAAFCLYLTHEQWWPKF